MSQPPKPDDEFRLADPNRVETFSDGVFAIIITLLVLEIHRPSTLIPGRLAEELFKSWPSYLAYVLAFLYIGIIWINHHNVFRYLRKVNLTINWLNLGGLGLAALIPFPTGVMADAFRLGNLADEKTAVVLYALVTGLMSAAWLPVFPYLRRHPELLKPEVELGNIAAQVRRPVVGVVSYALAALTGWFIHPACAIAFFVFMVAYHALTSEGVRSRKKS
jgi:uncharacterized membrane protein